MSSLLDYFSLAIPLNWQDPQWQINFTSQIVDRGIIPMVGISFFLVGYWMDANGNTSEKSSVPDLRLPVFLLASFLGLLFLLMVPLQLSSLNRVSTEALNQIQEGAGQAEERIQAQYDQLNQIAQNPESLKQIDQNIQQIDQALASGQLEGQQLNQQQIQELQQQKQQLDNLRQLASNPQQLEEKLNEIQTQLRSRKLERQNQVKAQMTKQGVRVGLSSLMLAVGYTMIGWLGLKGMGVNKPKARKKPSKS